MIGKILQIGCLLLLPAGSALAQPKPDPDWPCIQRKVPTISAGTMWSGPDVASGADWAKDFEAAELAQKLASRRTELSAIGNAIDEFAKDLKDDKATRLTRVFVGALELINTERDRILDGITRYARGQRLLAERLREESDKISAARDGPGAAETKEIQELEKQFAWDKRIFEDRRQSLTYVCETPVMLEQRAFEIARRIQERL